MIINYIKSAFRSMQRNRLHTALNIFGLALCLSVLILSVLYIKNELSYDKDFDRASDVYRIGQSLAFGGKVEEAIVTSSPLASTMQTELPQVEAATRMQGVMVEGMVFKNGDKSVYNDKIAIVDAGFIKVFSFPLLYGDPDKVLAEPGHVLLSQDVAYALFGNQNPVGKTLIYGTEQKTTVVDGVIKKTKNNSHLNFEIYIGFQSYQVNAREWGVMNMYHTYAKLKEGATRQSFEEGLSKLHQKYVLPNITQYFPDSNNENSYFFTTCLTDIHLKSNYLYEISPNGSMMYVYLALILAFIIMAVASINYINLATAQSQRRAKEIGVRKVSGSSKKMLITQFIVEAIMQSYIALFVALICTELLLPVFNRIIGASISLFDGAFGLVFILVFAITTIVGFVSGIFPAFVLARFEPVKVLKGSLSASKKGGFIRKTLVVTQFAVSAILIVMVMFIYNQVNYMHSKDLGFSKDQVLSVKLKRHSQGILNYYSSFKQEVLKDENVKNVSFSSNIPGSHYGQIGVNVDGGKIEATCYTMIDDNYINVLNIELLEGRNFFKNDSVGPYMMVNEAFVRKFNLSGSIVGQKVKLQNRDIEIIGLVKDFHIDNFETKIAPISMFYSTDEEFVPVDEFVVRFDPKNVASVVKNIETIWNRVEPDYPVDITFLDDKFGQLFKKQEQFGKLFIGATLFTVLVAMLGLFGLASFSAQQRKREIGIRKVMGASDSGIMYMLVAEFVKLVIIASVIGFVIAFFLARKWLSGFVYHIDISAIPFILTFILSMIIAVVTVAWQAHLASTAKPVDVIRYE